MNIACLVNLKRPEAGSSASAIYIEFVFYMLRACHTITRDKTTGERVPMVKKAITKDDLDTRNIYMVISASTSSYGCSGRRKAAP